MSVSFYVSVPVKAWELACGCGNTRAEQQFDTYAEVVAAVEMNLVSVSCEDEYCAAYSPRGHISPVATAADNYEVNMSNVNAREVLAALGLVVTDEGDGWTGSLSADDLFGRILIAEAVAPVDEGTPTYQEGNMVFCGRPAGYLQGRLNDLRYLAEFARKEKALIAWS